MDEIIREIGAIARALDSISNIEFQEVDLTRGQYLYLVRICEHPGIIQEKLAEMINVDRTTTARAVKKLIAKDLIKSMPDKKTLPNGSWKKSLSVYPSRASLFQSSSCQRVIPARSFAITHTFAKSSEKCE